MPHGLWTVGTKLCACWPVCSLKSLYLPRWKECSIRFTIIHSFQACTCGPMSSGRHYTTGLAGMERMNITTLLASDLKLMARSCSHITPVCLKARAAAHCSLSHDLEDPEELTPVFSNDPPFKAIPPLNRVERSPASRLKKTLRFSRIAAEQ